MLNILHLLKSEYKDILRCLEKKDPFPRENYVWERVVKDKNIITAQRIAFMDFAIEICDWFNLFENQEEKDKFVETIKVL